jgi:hypothetical protein
MAFIRKDRYGYEQTGLSGSVWGQFAGTLMKDCGVDITDAAIDFVHMVAVIDIEYTQVSELPYRDTCYDVLMIWGGDLETFMIDVDQYAQTNPEADPKALEAYAQDLLWRAS